MAAPHDGLCPPQPATPAAPGGRPEEGIHMTTLLAKILHAASTATGSDPEGHPSAARSPRAGKPRLRWTFTAAMTPPLVMMLLSAAGTAQASSHREAQAPPAP